MSERRAPNHRIRRSVTWVLVVLSALLVPVSVLTVWAIRTVTNTDQYVATMAPLAKEHVITDYVAVRATNILFEKVDVEARLKSALPPKASFVAAPVTKQLHGYVQDEFKTLLRSTWFQQAWDKANRRVHSSLVTFLEGTQLPAGQKVQEIAIKLDPVLGRGIAQLDKRGVTVFDPLKAKLKNATNLSVVVASKPQVKSIRGLFHLANQLGWVVPLVALVAIAGAVGVAVDRRKALLRVSVGVAISTAVVLGLIAYGRNFTVSHASSRASPDVTGTIFDTLSQFLHDSVHLTLLVSVIVAVLLWLIGPARWSRALRGWAGKGLHWLGQRFGELTLSARRTHPTEHAKRMAHVVLEHASGLRLLGVAVVACILVFGGNLSTGGLLWGVIGLALYLAAVELVLLWGRRLTVGPGSVDEPMGSVPAEPSDHLTAAADAVPVASSSDADDDDR
jgi:hypothetical protein